MTENGARDPVEVLAEEFTARLRRGERPSVSEYAAAHPHLADEIRDLFPALLVLDEAKPPSDGPPHADPGADEAPERLGEYRVLREVARGGMGVVYEAEQVALGRHVALKVLPPRLGADPLRLLRFRREARSAARLHHTNIVPVFDVGSAGGVHYYAMQFIRGQGLDEVFRELRRLRSGAPTTEPPPDDLTVSLADGLRTGAFPGAPVPPSAPGGARSDPSAILTGPVAHYFRSVAGLGVQAADALAHAHAQRVLHRDVKPSNLLLDRQGTLWLTDFGLAKDEGDDLTRTGDVVGTLRYMAPERFRGLSDPRTDVYALGVTLYELLTLRPAFDDADRAVLVRRIEREEPPRPRAIDPTVPRDLETVVLKAIEKDPARRYATAADLADDLKRFLADRPVRARRASAREQAWRWCRRNPGVAAALGLAFLLLSGGVAGTSVGLVWAERAREAEADQRRAAERERDDKEAARQEAVANLRTARQVVDRFLTQVSESHLFGVPRMEPVRRQLLQDAAEVYQNFLRLQGDDPQLRQEAALAYGRYGRLCAQLGRNEEAERAVRRALALLAELAADGPRPADLRAAEVDCYLQLGGLLYDRPGETERYFRLALPIAQALAAQDPGNRTYRRQLSFIRCTLSRLVTGTNRAEAEALCRAVLAAEEEPDGNPDSLAFGWLTWGYLQRDRRPAEAERAYRLAAAGYERLAADPTTGMNYFSNLAEARFKLATQLKAARKHPEAEAVARRSLADYQAVVAASPSVPNYALSRAQNHMLLAAIQEVTGRPTEAVASAREAIAVLEKMTADLRGVTAEPPLFGADGFPTPQATPWPLHAEHLLADARVHLAVALAADGRPAEADAIVGELVARLDRVQTEFAGRSGYRAKLAVVDGATATNLLTAGRPGPAEPLARRALARYTELAAEAPDNPDLTERVAGEHFRLGDILTARGRPDEAAESYARAAPLYGRLADAGGPRADRLRYAQASSLNNVGWQLATADGWKARDPAKALAAAKAATGLLPKAEGFWNTLGAAHYRAGEWTQAVAALERSMQLRKGGDSFDWFFLAMAKWQLGEREAAREWYAKAVRWMADHQPKDAELLRFRAEAVALIEPAPPRKPN